MLSHSHMKKRRSTSSAKSIASCVAKAVAGIIPDILSKIQTTPSPNASVDSKPEAPKPTTFTHKHFLTCNPELFTGTEGASRMLCWFQSTEMAFINSDCPDHLRTRSATGVFRERALDWWNNERTTRGNDEAIALSWDELKQLMLKEFLPAHEEQKLEEEFWNLKQIGGNNLAYTTRFKQLSYLVPHLVLTPERAIAKYLKGLPTMIKDAIQASGPTTIESVYRLAATLTDNHVQDGSLSLTEPKKNVAQVVTETPAPKDTKPQHHHHNNRKRKNYHHNHALTATTPQAQVYQAIMPPPQNPAPQAQVFQAMIPQNPAPPLKKNYVGAFPECNICHYHHPVKQQCRQCTACGRAGHLADTCRSSRRPQNANPAATINQPQNAMANRRGCYLCGDPNHFRAQCPRLNQGPQAGQAPVARGRVFNINMAQAQNDNEVVNGNEAPN